MFAHTAATARRHHRRKSCEPLDALWARRRSAMFSGRGFRLSGGFRWWELSLTSRHSPPASPMNGTGRHQSPQQRRTARGIGVIPASSRARRRGASSPKASLRPWIRDRVHDPEEREDRVGNPRASGPWRIEFSPVALLTVNARRSGREAAGSDGGAARGSGPRAVAAVTRGNRGLTVSNGRLTVVTSETQLRTEAAWRGSRRPTMTSGVRVQRRQTQSFLRRSVASRSNSELVRGRAAARDADRSWVPIRREQTRRG